MFLFSALSFGGGLPPFSESNSTVRLPRVWSAGKTSGYRPAELLWPVFFEAAVEREV